jgi:phytoene synthase
MMSTVSISELVGSSLYAAIADDAIKDEDNAAWVMELPPAERQAWIERIGWIRNIDRLAEQDLLDCEQSEFQDFQTAWQTLWATGQVPAAAPQREVLCAMHRHWFEQPQAPINQLSIQSWDRYVQALHRYHRENLVLETLEDFELMLNQLAASFFQVLPFLQEQHWQAAGQFGVVDQFYNILRDLREDAEQSICYLPLELLDRFGVTRTEVLQLRASENPGYPAMMRFWMYDYSHTLYRKAYPFILAPDLHPSWEILRDWCLYRYRRIERILRYSQYDYVQFPQRYWREVKRELALLLPSDCSKPFIKLDVVPNRPWTKTLFQFVEQAPNLFLGCT